MKKLLPERRREKPQIILTNLIDVILLLVFFFMITSSFAKDNRKLPINVPKASSGAVVEEETMTFQVSADGQIFFAGSPISYNIAREKVSEFVSQHLDRSILVEADQDVDYGKVVSLLDVIRTSGGVNIGLSTKAGTNAR